MGPLRIFLLGVMRITLDGWQTETQISRTVKTILAYLTLFRKRTHAREVLAGLFWGDHSEDRARSCLSTAIWRLRKVIEPEGVPRGTYLLTTSRGEVGFNPQSNHWLDVEVFEEISGQILAKPFESLETKDVVKLEDALKLYTGELLEGFYEDWALRERERLRSLYLHSLIHLLQFYRHQQAFEMSLACCHKIIDLDPLREEIHREMMRLYYRNGQRALALRQYEKCRETLALELGVAPMEETQILYAQISKKTGGGLPPLDQQLDLITAHNILAQLRRNIHDFEKSTDMLRHSAKNLEGVIKGRK